MGNNHSTANISAMLTFSRVVELGSFTEAARQLGRSKAAISREISALEARLGAQLLRRTTRSMSLTEVGEIFYRRCLRVVEEAEAAELSVSQLSETPRGVIRVAAPMSFGHLEIAPRLHRFMDRYPGIEVELELTDRSVDLVHERIDLSIRIRRPRNQTYVLRRLCPIRGLLVASPEYLTHNPAPENPADLLRHNCLTYRGRSEAWDFATGQRIEVAGNFRVDNGDALREAALAGQGIIYQPSFLLADAVRAGQLIPLLLDQIHPGSACFAVYPESRHLSPKVRAMIDWLVEDLGAEPSWDAGLPVEGRRPGKAYIGAS
ncbi:MAG: LysR family transcriptional regulator [Myxococcota bacterium]